MGRRTVRQRALCLPSQAVYRGKEESKKPNGEGKQVSQRKGRRGTRDAKSRNDPERIERETGEPDDAKVCAAGRGAASLTQSRGVRRETPGSSTDLKAKAGGDKSLSEKREAREGVYRVVLRDPRDRVRAALPEPQSPAVELHTRRDHAWLRRHYERTEKVSRCVLFA